MVKAVLSILLSRFSFNLAKRCFEKSTDLYYFHHCSLAFFILLAKKNDALLLLRILTLFFQSMIVNDYVICYEILVYIHMLLIKNHNLYI